VATTPDEDPPEWQDQLRDFMESAQKPQPPLNNTELKKVRLLLVDKERREWLWKRFKVLAPWILSIVTSVAAGAKWIIETLPKK
jgi:hypothetical protein